MSGKISVGLRMDPEKAEVLKRAAKDDHRTVASLLDKLVDGYLSEHGYLPTPAAREPQPRRARTTGGRRP